MKLIATLILAACATAAFAQNPNVLSAPMIKQPPVDAKKTVLIVVGKENAVYGCPDGYEMYVRRVKPKDSKEPEDNYKSWLYVPAPNPANPNAGHVDSIEGQTEFVGACMKVE
jgi:hypothetical protein